MRSYLDMNDALTGTTSGLSRDVYTGQFGSFTAPQPVDPSNFVHISGEETITGKKKFGDNSNHSYFDSDGTLRHVGNATIWDDINVSMVPPAGGGAAPAIIAFNGDTMLDCYAFAGIGAVPDEFHSSLEILHAYKEGSDIHFHIHWYPTDANTGNVKWQLRYTWFNRGTVPPAATTVSSTQATPGVAWQEMTANFVISGAGKTMGSRFVFVLFRDPADAADTYAHQAAVTDMGIHYEKDSEGSNTILTK